MYNFIKSIISPRSISLFYQSFSYSKQINFNLYKLLESMPKEPKHIVEAQKQRQKIKDKAQKYVPGTVTLQVLGSGAEGAPKSLYIFTDHSRYLFNCGEGTQRLAHEHKMKLSRLEHIFVTQAVWSNLGGLPGVALTIQDVGVSNINLHGPPGLDELFSATRRFVVLKDLTIKMLECNNEVPFEDNVMVVQYVPITKIVPNNNIANVPGNSGNNNKISKKEKRRNSTSKNQEDSSEDDVDYYAHEKTGTRTPITPVSQIPQEDREQVIVMCYIGRLRPRPGTLSLEKCVEAGVPAGPLLGQLKAGENITLPDGKVVLSKDVCSPDDPGPIFIVADCPETAYLDSFLSRPEWAVHQATATRDVDLANVVIHFSPPNVIDDVRYRSWIEKFSPSTQHIILNSNNKCLGSSAVYRVQNQLNLLDKDIFPLLKTQLGCVFSNQPPMKKQKTNNDDLLNNGESVTKTLETLSVKSKTDISDVSHIQQASTLWSVHLRPRKGIDRLNQINFNQDTDITEVLNAEGVADSLKKLLPVVDKAKRDLPDEEFPKILFLGTGSCIPNKTRNTSGILLETSPLNYILFDCGEGTFGQLVRFFGVEGVLPVMKNLKGVYVSHLHADHHIGLVGLLTSRHRLLEQAGIRPTKLVLIAPKQIMWWLNMYHRRFEHILDDFELVANGDLVLNNHTLESSSEIGVLNKLSLNSINTIGVRHCPNAFGIAIETPTNKKLTYSGDTMPCDQLIDLGLNSDILIHEATMEDELIGEARMKMHSTTSQAIEVGTRMNAKFVLLTHFSQRYARLPRIPEDILSDNVGIAFDNMMVSLKHLSLLPLFYPTLKLVFHEHCEELEQKAAKRNARILRQRDASRQRQENLKEIKDNANIISIKS